MHICHIITRLIIGGAQENTVLTCRGLVEKGHRVTLIAGPETGPEGSLWAKAEASGAEVIKLKYLKRRVNPVGDWQTVQALRRVLREIKPDVVHTHSSKAGILGRWAAHRERVPVIIHTIHGMSFNRTQSGFMSLLYRTLERWAGRYTTKWVTVADAMIDQSVEAKIAPRARFVTIRSGMETECFAPDTVARAGIRKTWGFEEDDIVVGTIARLFQNKGYEEIIQALPKIVKANDRIRFVWIGDGKHRSRYEQQLEALGLRDRVLLTGLIEPEEVSRCLNGFDVVLHASRWEGLPRAIVQGLLNGKPAVSFDNDGAPEVVIPDETGLLIPLGQVQSLADAVVTLARDPSLRQRLGQAGREKCLTMFDWRKMVQALEALYDSESLGRSEKSRAGVPAG